MPIKSEPFDSVTAPAIPSGWTVASGFATNSSPASGFLTPTSSPNVLQYTGPGAGYRFGTFGTPDSNAGNVSLACNIAWLNSGSIAANISLLARGSASVLDGSTTSFYSAWGDLASHAIPMVGISRWVNGTQTWLSTLNASVATLTWYQFTLTAIGPNLSLSVQRIGDGMWLNSSGNYQAGQTNACTAMDSTITGAGYAGLACSMGSGQDGYFDDWVFSNAVATSAIAFPNGMGYLKPYCLPSIDQWLPRMG